MRHSNSGKLLIKVLLGIGCAPAFLWGCASEEFRYIPATHQAPDGRRIHGEAIYLEPGGHPDGNVRVVSMGIVDVKNKTTSKSFPALHMRMSVSNNSKKDIWRIEAEDQRVSFPNKGQTSPVFVNSEVITVPRIEVKPGELRSLDLYYPLPSAEQSEKDLPEFDFRWRLAAGDQLIEENTPFDRTPIPERPMIVYPYAPYPPYALGWGPVWWGGWIR